MKLVIRYSVLAISDTAGISTGPPSGSAPKSTSSSIIKVHSVQNLGVASFPEALQQSPQ